MSDVNVSLAADAPWYSELYGEFLSSSASRLQEVLHEYNPYLELVFIPSSKRDETDVKPFAIKDNSPEHKPYIIRHFTEQDIKDPAAILAWLFEGDLSKHTRAELLDRAQIRQQAEKLLETQKEADAAADRQDLIAALATGGRDKKHSFRHNGRVFTDRGSHATSTHV